MNDRVFSFVGGELGSWRVVKFDVVNGSALSDVARLNIVPVLIDQLPADAMWSLRGITSNERYITHDEKKQLTAVQPSLGRTQATQAALIPIRKSAAWWALAQDERRGIFAESSKHVAIGLKYLPAIARRLYHCRDLGENQPFDFLTWFEYAPADAAAFDELVTALRETEEWNYVDWEVDIRVVRDDG
jgi:Chlorite dismutase